MSNQIKNNEEEKKNKKKAVLIALLLLLFSILLFVGIVAAFYSDIFVKNGDMTTGTLKINGQYTFSVNGTDTQLEDITNLNPGDIIVITGTITNTGNKSAWVRDRIVFSAEGDLFDPYFEVYEGELTRTQLESGTPVPMDLDNGQIVSGNRVINGFGQNAETQSGADYEYIGDYTYDLVYTIYFVPEAGNETQGKTVNLSATVQALQFRNNNTTEPDDAAWATVTAAL